jgi:GrpB-like predicted nucleotidyltransferase (UPF0157 family)
MGLMRNIAVVEYSPEWPELFAAESERLAGALGSNLVEAHHIGSTSVPQLAAKPVIDILAVVRSLDELDAQNEAMIRLGYGPKGEFGIPGRRFFSKGPDDARTHHVHAFEPGHEEVAAHLRFRDYLRAHPKEARRYAELKKALAARHRNDIEAYIEGKAPFIHEILAKAATLCILQFAFSILY